MILGLYTIFTPAVRKREPGHGFLEGGFEEQILQRRNPLQGLFRSVRYTEEKERKGRSRRQRKSKRGAAG